MKPSIAFTKVWSDDDVLELMVIVCDGVSQFANSVYLGIDRLAEMVDELETFKEQTEGGLYDIELGGFGHEYENGGFHARLHFQPSGKLNISTYQQSEFQEFSKTLVASEAKLYLQTEPALLDEFISGLVALSEGNVETASLECV